MVVVVVLLVLQMDRVRVAGLIGALHVEVQARCLGQQECVARAYLRIGAVYTTIIADDTQGAGRSLPFQLCHFSLFMLISVIIIIF